MPSDDTVDLSLVLTAHDRSTSRAAYNAILDLVGNNHSGTLYSNAERATLPLLRIALAEPGWPANTALDVLTELIGSFQPAQAADAGRDAPDPGMKQRLRSMVDGERERLIALSRIKEPFGTAAYARELLAELDTSQ